MIRVRPEIVEELMRLQEKTRRPISEIASQALRYALDNSRLVKADCYDIEFGEEKKT